MFKDIFLARATDPVLAEVGQDGGLVSAILLYALENDIIDAALVSYLEGDGSTWKAIPGVARTRDDILASAGSRYTYSANPMAYAEAVEGGAERIALVGMSCQSSVPPVMKQRKAGKVARRLSLNIGLLCSKTFDDAIFEELFEAKYGLKKSEMRKMNIKGVFQIWMKNGDYHEVPLKECHAWTREGCKLCPDFAAEHADVSTGGIGKFNDWTLTIVRTDAGRELMEGMIRDSWLETRPGDDDPDAIALMHKLSIKSRKRWPEFAIEAPRLLPDEDVKVVALVADLMDRSHVSRCFRRCRVRRWIRKRVPAPTWWLSISHVTAVRSPTFAPPPRVHASSRSARTSTANSSHERGTRAPTWCSRARSSSATRPPRCRSRTDRLRACPTTRSTSKTPTCCCRRPAPSASGSISSGRCPAK